MINYHRVQRIKNVIYTLLALLIFLPFILVVVIFFSIAGRLNETAGTLGRLETMISDYYEAQPGPQSSLPGVENQTFIPDGGSSSSSAPEGGDDGGDTSGDDLSVPDEDEAESQPEDNPEEAKEPISAASPDVNLTVSSVPGSNTSTDSAASSGGTNSLTGKTWNPDSGR